MNPPSGSDAYPAQTATESPRDERALIQRMANGDEMALAAIYDARVSRVYSVVMNILRDRDEAEDVVEETFWQVWQRAASYDASRGTVSTWILTIARSRALDRLRTRQRQRSEPMADRTDVAWIVAPSDPGRDAEGQERRTVIANALQMLPEEQRHALELAYFKGLSQSEIADHLGQPLGTIKTRMRLGMRKLREQLMGYQGDVA